MIIASGALLLGFILLIWSADRFVLGASCSARIFGIPPLIVGVVVVGFGTSAPEMLVSAIAAYNGQPVSLHKGGKLTRLDGCLLLSIYLGYMGLLYVMSSVDWGAASA